jgi:hypothetical protein
MAKRPSFNHPIDSVMSGVSIWRDPAGNMYSIEQNNNLKERTLLLRRTPNGVVSTVAGAAYGHVDGKGTAAKLSSVTAMTFGPDGDIYLTDGTGVRRATLDGDVKTIAKDVTSRTAEDKPTLFGGKDKNIFGLAVDSAGNIYVADAGNRRLVKVANDGRVSVVYRLDPPYFPTGVFATANGDVYVLEFSFTPPGTTDQPRVRKISADGQNKIIGSTGRTGIGFIIARPRSQLPYGLQRLLAIVTTSGFVFRFVDRRRRGWRDNYLVAQKPKARHMKRLLRILKWIAILLVVVFIGIQFYRPARTNPAIDPNADDRSPNADDTAGRINSRPFVSRLSFKQDGVAVVHAARTDFMVARQSCKRRPPRLEPFRIWKAAARPPGAQAEADLR